MNTIFWQSEKDLPVILLARAVPIKKVQLKIIQLVFFFFNLAYRQINQCQR